MLRRSDVIWWLNWRGQEKRNRISHRPSEHLAKSTSKALEISLFLNVTREDISHQMFAPLSSLEKTPGPCTSPILSLKNFRQQDDSQVPAKVGAKLLLSSVEPEFQTGRYLLPFLHCMLLLTYIYTHVHMHAHTHGCTDIVQSHTTHWNITGQREKSLHFWGSKVPEIQQNQNIGILTLLLLIYISAKPSFQVSF